MNQGNTSKNDSDRILDAIIDNNAFLKGFLASTRTESKKGKFALANRIMELGAEGRKEPKD